jgi:putative ABC transport system permease protein
LYKSEQNFKNLFSYFTIIALIIACLGLFGLATFTAEQRTKEIGVRKVLGATVANIVAMLSKDFLKLVAIAAVIAFPIAWFIMNKWLQDFSYRVNINWWVFVVSGIAAVVIALLTISYQAIKAGVANPVKSLRTE